MPFTEIKRMLICFLLLSLIFALSGCGAAVTAVGDNALYSSAPPPVMIKGNPPLKLLGYGRVNTSIKTNSMLAAPVFVRYAFFSDTESGLVQRHGHAMILDLPSGAGVEFPLESKAWNTLYFSSGKYADGRYWTTQLLFVAAKDDWISAMWQANGRSTGKLWLAKRWSATVLSQTRFVAEYREPMPECMLRQPYTEDLPSGVTLNDYLRTALYGYTDVSGVCGKEVLAFEERADKAFTLGDFNQANQAEAPGPNRLPVQPNVFVNAEKLAGEAEVMDRESHSLYD